MTEFGRRIFAAMMTLEQSEGGFSKAMLGQFFTIEEIGRIERIELDRRQLVNNDRAVLISCIEALKQENEKKQTQGLADELSRLREKNQKAKDYKNT